MNNLEFKKFRKNTKLTQKEFADRIGVSSRIVQKWEKGEVEISKKNLTRIMGEFSSHFDRKSSHNEQPLNLFNNVIGLSEKTVDYFINNYGNKFYVRNDGNIEIEVINIPLGSYKKYMELCTNRNKLTEVFNNARFYVEKIDVGNFEAFTLIDEAMNGGLINDSPAKAKVLGKELSKDEWVGDFNSDKGYIIITELGDFHRDINSYDFLNHKFILNARNKEFKTIEIEMKDVIKIFKVIARTF